MTIHVLLDARARTTRAVAHLASADTVCTFPDSSLYGGLHWVDVAPGPEYCGTGCTSNCDAKAECGQYSKEPGKTCPLNVWYAFPLSAMVLPSSLGIFRFCPSLIVLDFAMLTTPLFCTTAAASTASAGRPKISATRSARAIASCTHRRLGAKALAFSAKVWPTPQSEGAGN